MNFALDEATAIVEYACEAITLLENGKLTDAKREEVTKQLLAALPYLDHLKYVYPEKEFPFKLYRVRSEKGLSKEEAVTDVQTFSYPSPKKCDTARANKKGCPVFYVADNPATALKEAECKTGEMVYVTQWEVENPTQCNLFLFFEEKLPDAHPWEKIRAQQDAQFQENLAQASGEVKKKWHQLHKAFCRAFLGEDYEISSLIGHQLLHANNKPEVQLLVYPSTVESEQYCNLAIHPDFADKHLRMKKAWKIQVKDEKLTQRPKLLETGEVKEQHIHWRKPVSADEGEELPL